MEEVIELAALILGREFNCEYELEEALQEGFGVNLEDFKEIVDALVPFTPSHISPLTGREYQGFVNEGAFVYKKQVQD